MARKGIICFVILAASLSGLGQQECAAAYRYMISATPYLLPEVEAAQNELDELSRQWKKEVESRFDECDRLQKAYEEQEKSLAPDEKQCLQQEYSDRLAAAVQLRSQRFGVDGDLFKKRRELLCLTLKTNN